MLAQAVPNISTVVERPYQVFTFKVPDGFIEQDYRNLSSVARDRQKDKSYSRQNIEERQTFAKEGIHV